MRIDVLTLFPEMFDGVFGASILGKARDKGIVSLQATNFRQFSTNKHSTVDDYPYGGGGGMVLKPEPMFAAVEHLVPQEGPRPRVILLCPQGETFTQRKAEELSQVKHLIFVCGHYEGYDERIREHLVTDELSIGDYVLTGGELPAMVAIDSIVRLLPGVLGNETSAVTDSFSTGLLEYPHYTRPAVFRDWEVPEVLVSGNHARIDAWRREQSLLRTLRRRPELLERAELTPKERVWLKALLERETSSSGVPDSEGEK
ncbi:tRNA (guanosine(37)-N1)-methyltransferase TrmD [Paenibacillus sp. MMS18-CY102]|uniref:tRNA (guanosine(37)-N1)-methyltransferase TrmD n=1 Tax=Paenibacillus sp. MMS18-CY102 TaxID=2682849 RepID=UPI0013653B42|nr:tRNA (guanosine(37)-N1)-methyltransferase TrmD [Paenibacillus sp. MMS18-CY102]MWC26591.1 tRNA (guanosine(37)-N1)-methyltransferase TrmD [Paenibacillus sp. MMS18-CY102]